MVVYAIIDLMESLMYDEDTYQEYVRKVLYANEEDAYNQIIKEIETGDFVNPYEESIKIEKSNIPTIDQVRKRWWHIGEEFANGYEIREFYLSMDQ